MAQDVPRNRADGARTVARRGRAGPPRSETQPRRSADHREGNSNPSQGQVAGVVERTSLTSSWRFDLFWRLQLASVKPTEVIWFSCERPLRARSGRSQVPSKYLLGRARTARSV
jgi:hypothetical protein